MVDLQGAPVPSPFNGIARGEPISVLPGSTIPFTVGSENPFLFASVRFKKKEFLPSHGRDRRLGRPSPWHGYVPTKPKSLLTLPDGGVGGLSKRVQGREELLALTIKQPGASQCRNSCLGTG